MDEPTESSEIREIVEKVRSRVVEQLNAFRPGPGTYITSFCVGATIAAYTSVVQAPSIEAGLMSLAAAIGVNRLSDLIGKWQPKTELTQQELISAITKSVEDRLREGEPLPGISPLLEQFGLVELAMQNWQQTNDQHWQLLVTELAHLSQLIALTQEIRDTLERWSPDAPARRNVYVGIVWDKLEPYRSAAVQYFKEIGDKVLADREISLLPESQRLGLINECDLFIGIYGHEQSEIPLETTLKIHQEFEYVVSHFRRALIFCAAPSVETLSSTPPPEPDYGDPPLRPNKPTLPPEPIPISTQPWRTVQHVLAIITNRPTPDEIDRENWADHKRERHQIIDQHRTAYQNYVWRLKEYEDSCALKREQHALEKEAYDEKINKHKDFLHEIREHSASPLYFESVDLLKHSIQQQLDAYEKGVYLGLSMIKVVQRWQDWATDQWQGIEAKSVNPDALLFPSPLEAVTDSFVHYDWHRIIEAHANSLIEATNAIYDFRSLRLENEFRTQAKRWLKKPVDCQSEKYPTISKQLKGWIAVEPLFSFNEALAEIRKGRKNPELNSRIEKWHQVLESLAIALDWPSYGRCLLIMGSAGSGKTHLMVRLLHGLINHEPNEPLYYPVYIPENATLLKKFASKPEQLVLEAGQLHTNNGPGPKWRSLEELADFVSQLGENDNQESRLVILLDNIHLWVRDYGFNIKALQNLIEEHTHLHQLYWVISISEAYYDMVSDRVYEKFWREFGFVPNSETAMTEGWIEIDAINADSGQWKQIIQHKLDARPLPTDVIVQLDTQSQTWLTNPFIAWIFNESYKTGELKVQELLNLNYVEFVERFWKTRLEQLAQSLDINARIQDWESGLLRTMYLIAEIAVEECQTSLKAGTLAQHILAINEDETVSLRDEEHVETFIHWLRQMQLLSKVRTEEGQDRLKLETFTPWQWQSGRYLTNQLPNYQKQGNEVETWLMKHFVVDENENFWQGVIEFFILLTDTKLKEENNFSRSNQPQFFISLIKTILTLPITFQSMVWLAASKISPSSQKLLSESIDSSRTITLSHKADLHRFLYFLKYAELPEKGGVALWLRVQLMQEQYSAIQKFGYVGYFERFLNYLVDIANNAEELAEALAYLHKIEEALDWTTTERLAEWTHRSLQRVAARYTRDSYSRETAVNKAVLRFLEIVSGFELPNPWGKDDERRQEIKAKHYQTHWVQLIKQHCDYLVEQQQAECLNWLEENGWMQWSKREGEINMEIVQRTMSEQLTVICGRWFRENRDENDPDEPYTQIVAQWANSSLAQLEAKREQKKAAAFLIYHTVPSEGEFSNRPVGQPLWDIFLQLRQDSDHSISKFMNLGIMQKFYDVQANQSRRNS